MAMNDVATRHRLPHFWIVFQRYSSAVSPPRMTKGVTLAPHGFF